jgi:hypothetical protein
MSEVPLYELGPYPDEPASLRAELGLLPCELESRVKTTGVPCLYETALGIILLYVFMSEASVHTPATPPYKHVDLLFFCISLR